MSIVQGVVSDKAGSDIVFFANTDWYLYNFRLSLAEAVRDRGQRLLLVSPDGPFGPKLRELGFRWHPLPMERRSLRPDAELRVILRLVALLRRERPALIHNFTIKCAVYGSMAARLADIACRVNAIAGLGYTFTNDDLLARVLAPAVRSLMRATLGGAGGRLILQNPDDQALFARMGFSPTTMRLIPGSGVDCARFVPSPARTRIGRRQRVLFAGRVLWDKGVAEFVDAARRLAGPGVEFVIAGAPDPGNPASVPPAMLDRWVQSGLVTWLGHVDNIAALLGDVDVFVLPSYREGLPKSLIEAAACALPLVASDVPGCREVIRHEKDGLLVPVRNAEALGSAIQRLLTDKALSARLGDSARVRAVREFNQEIVIKDTLSVYDELLQRDSIAGSHSDRPFKG